MHRVPHNSALKTLDDSRALLVLPAPRPAKARLDQPDTAADLPPRRPSAPEQAEFTRQRQIAAANCRKAGAWRCAQWFEGHPTWRWASER